MKIADTSCIVCIFVELNRPYILMDWTKRGYQIVLTEEVYQELIQNRNTIQTINPEIKNGNIKIQKFITENELEEFRTRYPILGKGESSVIVAALRLNHQKHRYYAIIDDANARKIAIKLGVNLTGTYGLLKILKEKSYIDEKEFDTCKCDMNKSRFRINFDKVK